MARNDSGALGVALQWAGLFHPHYSMELQSLAIPQNIQTIGDTLELRI